MFNDVKSQFVMLGDGVDPETIPKHYRAYYDRASKVFRQFGHFKGLDEVHPNFWPLICLIADQEKRIEELEAQLKGSTVEQRSPNVEGETLRVDMRTREGRALKTKDAQEVGV